MVQAGNLSTIGVGQALRQFLSSGIGLLSIVGELNSVGVDHGLYILNTVGHTSQKTELRQVLISGLQEHHGLLKNKPS